MGRGVARDGAEAGYDAMPGALDVPIDAVEPDPEPVRRWRRFSLEWNPPETFLADVRPRRGENRSEEQILASISFKYTTDGLERQRELEASIGEHGILVPLLVRAHPERPGAYHILDGNRRHAAARAVGLARVPIALRDTDAARALIYKLIGNLHREPLAPVDEARAYRGLLHLLGGVGAVSTAVGKRRQHVNDRLRLLRYEDLALAVEANRLDVSTAREIMRSTMPTDEAEMWRARIANNERVTLEDVRARRQDARGGPASTGLGVADDERSGRHGEQAPRRVDAPSENSEDTGDAAGTSAKAIRGSSPGGEMLSRSASGERAMLPPTGSSAGAPTATPAPPTSVGVIRTIAVDARSPSMREAEAADANMTAGIAGAHRAPRTESAPVPMAGLNPLNRAQAAAADDDRLSDLLSRFSPGERQLLDDVLLYGAGHGWSCLGMHQKLRTPGV